MTWTKLGDTFADDMDADSISCEAVTLHVAALIFCNRMGTDGRIPKHMTRRLYSAIADTPGAVQQLLDAGHWVEDDAGYEIVDFLKDQDSADMVAHRQEARRDATRRWREKKQGYDTSNGESRSTVMHHQTVTGDKKHHRDALPPRPAPSRPKEAGKGRVGTTANGSAGASPSPTPHPGNEKKRPPGSGLIDIQTLLDGDSEEGVSVQAPAGRITYEIELADDWYDDEKDRYIPDSSGIWLSTVDLDIDEADYVAEAQGLLYNRIKDRLYEAKNGRPLRGFAMESTSLSIGIRTKDAAYWLEKLEEILVTDEVQELAQAVVETAENCIFPFQVSGLNGEIRIGPDVTEDGEKLDGRTIVYAAVTAWGPNPELQSRREDLHEAIGQQVIALIGEGRTCYRAEASTHAVAFSINESDDWDWLAKFQEAINTDEVQELAQEVFSMTTSRETTPEASR